LQFLFSLQLFQKLAKVFAGVDRGEPRIVLQPFQVVEAFRNRLPEVSKGFVRLLQLSKGNGVQVPALGPIGPLIYDLAEVRCGFVPLREVEVDVPTVPPVRVHLGSQVNGLGKIGDGSVPLLPMEVNKRPTGPALPGIGLQLDRFRVLGGGLVPMAGTFGLLA